MWRRPGHRRVECFGADQGAVWQEVDDELASHHVASPTSSLSDAYADRRVSAGLDKFDAGLELPEATRGVVVAFGDRIVSAEIFECPVVFKRLWPRILRSYALTAMNHVALQQMQDENLGMGRAGSPGSDTADHRKTEAVGSAGAKAAPTLEQAEAFLLEPCGIAGKPEDSVGLGQDVRWEANGFLACSLFHEGRMLHGTVYGKG